MSSLGGRHYTEPTPQGEELGPPLWWMAENLHLERLCVGEACSALFIYNPHPTYAFLLTSVNTWIIILGI